jgi:WD40 repeat protein
MQSVQQNANPTKLTWAQQNQMLVAAMERDGIDLQREGTTPLAAKNEMMTETEGVERFLKGSDMNAVQLLLKSGKMREMGFEHSATALDTNLKILQAQLQLQQQDARDWFSFAAATGMGVVVESSLFDEESDDFYVEEGGGNVRWPNKFMWMLEGNGFRLQSGQKRASTGLLDVGNDVLLRVQGFLRWGGKALDGSPYASAIQIDDDWDFDFESFTACQFSPCGNFFSTLSRGSHLVKFWSTSANCVEACGTLKHSLDISSFRSGGCYFGGYRFCFSCDGKLLLTTSDNGLLRLWDTSLGKIHKTLNTGDTVDEDFDPDDDFTSESGDMQMTTHQVLCIALSPDGGKILCGTYEYIDGRHKKSLRLHDVQTEDFQQALPLEHQDLFFSGCACFSPSGKTYLVGVHGASGQMLLIDVTTKSCLLRFCSPQNSAPQQDERFFVGPTICRFAPDGKIALGVYSQDGGNHWMIKLWDVKTGECLRDLLGHCSRYTPAICDCVFSPDGTTVLSVGNCAILWEAATGKIIRVFVDQCENGGEGSTNLSKAWRCSFSPDGKKISAVFSNGNLQMWNLAT